jgi:hypothetical protein
MTRYSLAKLVLAQHDGVLRLGTSKGEVIATLGEPEDRSATRPPILKYGAMELTFVDNRLRFITCDVSPEHSSSHNWLRIDIPRLRPAVERWLAREKVAFAPDDALSYDDQDVLRIEDSDALLIFRHGVLDRVQVAA